MALILPNAFVAAEFSKSVPDSFLHDITQGILRSYELTETHRHINSKLYRKRYRANDRNGVIDSQLESIAKTHFSVEGVFRDNCTGSYTYTELTIDEKVVLTVSAVDSPKRLPRPSIFRLEAAMNNPEIRQLNLLSSNLIQADFVNKNISKKLLYGTILHGSSTGLSPDFIIIAIPDRHYRSHIATINLLEKYSTLSVENSGFVEQDSTIDLSVQEIEKPSAQLRIRTEEYIEEEDRIAGEIDEDFEDDGGQGA